MAWQEVEIWKFYKSELCLFEKITTELFIKTVLQEMKLDKIKQQNLDVTEEDIDQLLKLIKLTLKAIAIEDV